MLLEADMRGICLCHLCVCIVELYYLKRARKRDMIICIAQKLPSVLVFPIKEVSND